MLKDILKRECIRLNLSGSSKDEVIKELTNIFADAGLVENTEAVFKAVITRENTMTTALGKNVALPHAKTSEVKQIQMVIGAHPKGVEFDAPDHQPVHLFFAVLSPPHISGPHIQCLAEIARLIENKDTKQNILKAQSADEIIDIIKNSAI